MSDDLESDETFDSTSSVRKDLEAAKSAQEVIKKIASALEPFAEFAKQNVDADGWKSNVHRERISDWFGPTDFRLLRDAFDKVNIK